MINFHNKDLETWLLREPFEEKQLKKLNLEQLFLVLRRTKSKGLKGKVISLILNLNE